MGNAVKKAKYRYIQILPNGSKGNVHFSYILTIVNVT